MAILFSSLGYSQSTDDSNQKELKITEEGKLLEATVICLDAIESPTKYNSFANNIITLEGFPKKVAYNKSEDLKQAINNWFIENPIYIDKIRTERKKAHDKLYGKRPY